MRSSTHSSQTSNCISCRAIAGVEFLVGGLDEVAAAVFLNGGGGASGDQGGRGCWSCQRWSPGCSGRRERGFAETVALAWKWFVKLDARGKDATQFVSAFAMLAAKAVRSGHHLATRERKRLTLSFGGVLIVEINGPACWNI